MPHQYQQMSRKWVDKISLPLSPLQSSPSSPSIASLCGSLPHPLPIRWLVPQGETMRLLHILCFLPFQLMAIMLAFEAVAAKRSLPETSASSSSGLVVCSVFATGMGAP